MSQVSVVEALDALEIEPPSRIPGHIFCPVHDDSTPSFYVQNHRWHCFGCAVGGDGIDLVRFVTGASYPQAVQFLSGLLDELNERAPVERPERTVHDFTWELDNEASRTTPLQRAEARTYVEATWPHLTLTQLEGWGVRVGPYNLMIPHYGADGTVTAVKTRSFVGGKKGSKAAFPGSTYPLLYTVRNNPEAPTAVLCEGESDTWTLTNDTGQAYGLPSGAKAWRKYLDQLERFDLVYVALDADATGDQAADEILGQLGKKGVRLRPEGYKDWTDAILGRNHL